MSHDKYHEIDVMFGYLDYSDHLNVLELQRFEQKTNHVDQEFLAPHHSPLNVCYFEPLNIYYKHLKLSFVQVPSKQQAESFIDYLNHNGNDKEAIFSCDVFGRKLGDLIEEGMYYKLNMIPENASLKIHDIFQKL